MSERTINPTVRIGVVVALFAGLAYVATLDGVRTYFARDNIIATVQAAGLFGVVVYTLIFTVAGLVQVPGILFVMIARFLYGPIHGFIIAYIAGIIAVSVAFVVVRYIGGRALEDITWERARKILSHLDERPVRTVVILRSFMFLAPPLNYALAMSSIRYRDYLVGFAFDEFGIGESGAYHHAVRM